MNFISTITKEAIAELPREIYTGEIVVVDTYELLDEAIARLSELKEIGFDTETRPSFKKNVYNQMALMQFSGDDICYLVRLNKFDSVPPALETFLHNENVMKIGLSLRDDFRKLSNLTDVLPRNFIDLQTFVAKFGIEDISLRKIYAILFDKKISKRARTTNWEAETLNAIQQQYAALDAWACLRIYQYLSGLK